MDLREEPAAQLARFGLLDRRHREDR